MFSLGWFGYGSGGLRRGVEGRSRYDSCLVAQLLSGVDQVRLPLLFSRPSAANAAARACGVPRVDSLGFPTARAAYHHVGFGKPVAFCGCIGDTEALADFLDAEVSFSHGSRPLMMPAQPMVPVAMAMTAMTAGWNAVNAPHAVAMAMMA
ncbi:hypothetical protein BIFGAL_02786 [Bifidobacterium gallicum DSM 20093 = LMG 11596]|uniref:Uncharacterized protein n=1 Tax=Bifidobacterium gallicum DSM 20093 = LMG 11596 TaxID=561180 RepID=D1NSM7_9BIFI|nr:hypothetical protein BIFGAL_02786 [Bifidobacterium gallicum DSM 20093 = LMG 11596]